MQIKIKKLSFYAIIGILERERQAPQEIEVNAFLDYDYNDDGYIDYALVCENIQEWFEKEQFGLLEDALLFLEKELKEIYPHITSIELEISKPQIIGNARVSVSFQKNY